MLWLMMLTVVNAADVTHQGRLLDGLGVPLDGGYDVDVVLIDNNGDPLYTEDPGTVTVSDGYYSVIVSPTDAQLAAAESVRVLVGGVALGGDTPLTSTPNAVSIAGQTLADLDARYAANGNTPIGIRQFSWDDDGSAATSHQEVVVSGSYCSPRTFTAPTPGNYHITGRWTVIGTTNGTCRYINCYLAVDGVMAGLTYNVDDGLQSVVVNTAATYRSGSIEGVVALDGTPQTLQWNCQKASNCSATMSVQCDRNQVIIKGPYGSL